MSFVVVVCGGREYDDWKTLSHALNFIHTQRPITLLGHGGQRGADSMAGRWAKENGVQVQKIEANWARLGRAAGPIRNRQLLNELNPELVIAFPGGLGTTNMVLRATRATIKVWFVPDNWLELVAISPSYGPQYYRGGP